MDILSNILKMNLLSYFILFLMMTVFYFVNKIIEMTVFNQKNISKLLKKHNESFDLEDFESIDKIDTKLIETRALLKADRIYVVRFHNGEFFNSGNPIWKMSMHYEKCVNLISCLSKTYQDIKVSLYWSYLKYIFIGTDKLEKGIEIIKPKVFSCLPENCKLPRQVFLFNVNKMSNEIGSLKDLLFEHQVKYFIAVGIWDSITNDLLGYIGLEYKQENAYENIIKNSDVFSPCILCNAAFEVSRIWSKNPSIVEKRKVQLLNYFKRNRGNGDFKLYK